MPQAQMQNQAPQPQPIIPTNVHVIEQNDFIRRVFGWMGGGLFVTAFVSLFTVNSQALLTLVVTNPIFFFGLIIAELVAVVYLSRFVNRMSSTQAGIVFMLYSVLNGLTLSVVFLVYTAGSIASVFLVSALMFAVVSLYGAVTKRDLTTVGHLAFMALIGLIIASVVNMFLRSDTFGLFASYVGVVIFVGLTAYDTQKIKNMNTTMEIGSEVEKKASIIGALTLYLDFINLFLNLLRIMGKRR
jgi:uncharacterized protein